MSASIVDAAMAGDGQTAVVTALSIIVPATIVAADVALLFINDSTSTDTLSVSGWSVVSGPDANSTNSVTYCLGRTLVAADASASQAITGLAAGGTRVEAQMLVLRGVALNGLQVAVAVETTTTTTPTLPSLAGVPAGAMMVCAFNRRRSGASGNVTLPVTYTQPASNASPGTSYATLVNVYTDDGTAVTAAGGSVGGEAATTGVSAVGNNYLVTLPLIMPVERPVNRARFRAANF